MRILMLSAVIAVILLNDSCADNATNQNNLITTYDFGATTTQAQIGPNHPSFEHFTTKDQPGDSKHSRTIKLEDRIDEQPIKFEDDNDIEQTSQFDDGIVSNQNDLFLKTKILERAKIKFDDGNETSEDSDDREADDENHPRKVVFEDDKIAEGDSKYYTFESVERSTDNPIKFENNGKDSYPGINKANYDRNTKAGRISFTDDSSRIQDPAQKKKRKPRRKPTEPVQNSPYSGTGYPSHVSPSYATPSYSNSGHPYPGNSYPTPVYPHPAYLGSASGYGLFSTAGHLGSGEPRPTVYPVAYPNTGQGEHTGHPGSRYPNQDNPGSTQNGRPGNIRQGYPYNHGYPVTGYPQAYPGEPTSQYAPQSQPQYRPVPGIHQPGYQYGFYRPSRRPKSLPERAVSAVAEALTSIALYDDYQCVPRLLCESAGGSTTLPPTLLKATEGLQPLLMLLQAYNGVSSSPLFVFGRAAVTGMAAKGNPAACRQAYPQCPTDPEKLIHYLNNHNGGFFRFFGQPTVPQQQQNLEQFYGYLSGQYGFQQQTQPNYGYPSPYRYGLLPQYPNSNVNNYGINYQRDQNSYRSAKNGSEIEERIQNKPGINAFEDESFDDQRLGDDLNINSKWLFPEEVGTKKDSERDTYKIKYSSKIPTSLKFPDERSDDRTQINKPRDYVRKVKNVLFPKENHYQLYSNYYYQTTTPVSNEDYVFDHKHKFYVKVPKTVNTDDVVYVVRGNGDPNHPEIVKVRPGQRI